MNSKNIIKIVVTVAITGLFYFLYIQNISLFDKINSKLIDQFFEIRGQTRVDDRIVIVDIDDKSLKKKNLFLSENFVKILNNLAEAEPKVIAVCEVLPFFDSNSTFDKRLLVAGYMFSFNNDIKRGKLPQQRYAVIEKNYKDFDFIPKAVGYISNSEMFQKGIKYSGFINFILDDDGVVRSLPLVVKYDDTVYLSLTLEVIRYLEKVNKVDIFYSETGIDEIRVGRHTVQTDRFGREVLNFKKESEAYEYVNAYEVFEGSFKKEIFKDKIVLIGSTSLGKESFSIPIDTTFPKIEMIANSIDNILNQDFLIKPNWMEGIDLGVLTVMLFIVLLLSYLGIVSGSISFVVLIFGYLYLSFLLFVNAGVVLNIISVLLSSFLLFSVLTVLNYIFDLKQKRALQEELIKELQNRRILVEKEVMIKTKELKKALKEKTILLRELHHRVKNNLQLILSITRLQQNVSHNSHIKSELEKLQRRIGSIAKTHEILCENDDISNVDMNEYIGALCEEIENSLIYSDIKINLKIENVFLPLREAIYVGLIVNELIINSIKNSKNSKIENVYISLSREKNRYELIISDDGLGFDVSKIESESSLGLKLVKSLVMDQLEGKIEYYGTKDSKYIIEFEI